VRPSRCRRQSDPIRCTDLRGSASSPKAVVRDRLFLDGILRERTLDWYAQTKRGTVWYFGENTAELNRHGEVVSREGSFQSGRDGAQAGIFMPAHARVGQTFQQENYPGHAEDKFRILSLTAHVTTALVSSRHGMLTREWTRLEPGVVDHKSYIRDIGNVGERTIRGGHDFQQLVKDVAMHIAAAAPQYVRREEVTDDILARERAVQREKTLAEGKPEKVVDKIVEGRLEKFFAENVLLEQPFVKNPDVTVGELITAKIAKIGENVQVRRFSRFKLGEGIEKKVSDFAAEVAAQVG